MVAGAGAGVVVSTVAALYVDAARGPYGRLRGVDLYAGEQTQGDMFAGAGFRDALKYAGPHPVVAHPPCGHWGRFRRRCQHPALWREGGPRAVEQVREFGGVLEHPAHSTLWAACGLPAPFAGVDEWDGWTLAIEQVDWGHPCKKPTWLYIVGLSRDDLPPMPAAGVPTHCMVRLHRNPHELPELPKRQRHITPAPLARWLVGLARKTGETQCARSA